MCGAMPFKCFEKLVKTFFLHTLFNTVQIKYVEKSQNLFC